MPLHYHIATNRPLFHRPVLRRTSSRKETAQAILRRLSYVASRLANRAQLTTDGHKPYLNAVERAFFCGDRLCDAGEAMRRRRAEQKELQSGPMPLS